MYINTYTKTYIHTVHIYSTFIYTCIDTYKLYIHTYIFTYIHIYIHIKVDIDEMVVPSYETIERLKVSSPKTIFSALADTLESTYPNASHYCFQNVYFPMDHFPNHENNGTV